MKRTEKPLNQNLERATQFECVPQTKWWWMTWNVHFINVKTIMECVMVWRLDSQHQPIVWFDLILTFRMCKTANKTLLALSLSLYVNARCQTFECTPLTFPNQNSIQFSWIKCDQCAVRSVVWNSKCIATHFMECVSVIWNNVSSRRER